MITWPLFGFLYHLRFSFHLGSVPKSELADIITTEFRPNFRERRERESLDGRERLPAKPGDIHDEGQIRRARSWVEQ